MMLTTNNSKLVKAGKKHNALVASFTLPAGPTCPMAGKCAVGCYAKCGTFTWPAPKAKHADNYRIASECDFEWLMSTEVAVLEQRAHKRGKHLFVRIHDAGDFFSFKYLGDWARIAKRNPRVTFYAYTKSIHFVRGYVGLPSNMTFVFSEGGKLDGTIDTETERHTKVFSTEEELLAAGYVNASADDLVAADPNVLKVGLVFHGSKKQADAWGVRYVSKKGV